MCDRCGVTQAAGQVPADQAGAPGVGEAFFRQLWSPRYILDARTQRAQRPPGRAAAAPDDSPSPCVLLLSRSCDAELYGVERILAGVGVTSARLNSDELTGVDLLIDAGRRVVRLGGRWLAPTVVWVRHFCDRAIAGSGSPAHDLFLRDSWQATASQLCTLAPVSVQARRPGLLEQLVTAQRHGIAVPRTVVTTNLSRVRDALGSSRLVIKAAHEHFVEAHPGRLHGVFPIVVDRPATAAWRAGPPVVVQQYVEHDAELRVYFVHGEVHGFEVTKDTPADPWLAPDRVKASLVDLPPAVVAAAKTLANALSLRYGAFDFLQRAGEPVFLEVNPHGDWLWAEARARAAPVTLAFARMLARMHRQRRPTAFSASHQTNPDLLRFLCVGKLPAVRQAVPRRR